MKSGLRAMASVLAGMLVLFSISGCGSSGIKRIPYNKTADESISSGTVASTPEYELVWEDDAKCVMLKSLSNGKIWSTIPYNYYLSGGMSANVNSALNITVSNTQTLKWDTLNGYNEAYLDGRITCEETENGLKLTYYFEKHKISVPVVYTLRNDSVEISVDPSQISEGEEFSVVSVTPAPFLCAAENSDNNSYLFVPSGSGALMYTDARLEGDRQYSGEVYGNDGARILTELPVDDEAIRMPVYGVREGDNALLAIIEQGAESAVLEAKAGNSRTGYSNISATVYLRGYDVMQSGTQSLNWEDLTKVSEEISRKTFKIGFYPLKGEEADYMGMAKRYKKYLSDKKLLNESAVEDNTYGVTIMGGVPVNATVFGMPGKKLGVMTSFSAAEEILRKLSEISDMKPQVLLKGFGDGGINVGSVAGGFDFPKAFGGDGERRALENYCKDNGISVFTDFDLLRYTSSGNGFSSVFDTAKSASLQAVELSPAEEPLREFNKTVEYRLLKRGKVAKAADKLLKAADKRSISGIGLSSLSSIAYSDYSSSEYYVKGSTEADAFKYIKSLQKQNHPVAAASANSYAAAAADTLFDSPVSNGEYYTFDMVVPFYQAVFGGCKPIYSQPINLSADSQRQIMLSAIGGARPSFALINSFDSSFIKIQIEKLYGALFEDNIGLITQLLNKYEPFYAAISGTELIDYEMVNNNISKSVFSNGTVLYANHSDDSVESPVGSFAGYEIRWITDKTR